jgi:hypothetical protein
MSSINDFLHLLDGGDGGNGGGAPATTTTVIKLDGTIASVPIVTNTTAVPIENRIIALNYQILPEGFGSYLQGILPDDIATAAGAFSATMQQIKNIRKVDFEKFAQVVTSLETTDNLPLINGTNVPVDVPEAEAAYKLIALGTGPRGTYTFSDFFGCMSGLPYDWTSLQTAISNIPTGNLATIYSNLYAATQGPTSGLDAAVQAQIDLANAQIAIIRTTNPGQSNELNDLYNTTATQLASEQLARDTGLSAIPTPRTPGKHGDLFPYPTMIYSFTDLLPVYALLTAPNLSAQNLEAISNLELVAGQSIVGAMRAERNQVRLAEVGISPDDTIPDILPSDELGTAYPFNVKPELNILPPPNSSVAAVLGIGTPDGLPVPSPDIGIDTPGISQVSIPEGTVPFFNPPTTPSLAQPGGPIVPGSLAGSPYTTLIPPALNPVITSKALLPASLSVAQAIEQVITCNCDCWVH